MYSARGLVVSIRSIFLFFLVLTSEGKGAVLSGSFSPVPTGTNIDLTAIGTLDWVHWGLSNATSFNRKGTVVPQIGDFTVVYNTNLSYAEAYQYADNFNGYSWSDGFPAAGITNTLTGVYVVAAFQPLLAQGFEFKVPADQTLKTLHVWVGTYATRGRFEASLSDNSAPAYSDTSLINSSNGPGVVYSIDFAATAPGQHLNIRWTTYATVAQTNGLVLDRNVTLQAAALAQAGANNPPYASISNPADNALFTSPTELLMEATAFDPDGTVTNLSFLVATNELGTDASEPYAWSWQSPPPGAFKLSVKPADDRGGVSISRPVDVFINTTGGVLLGSVGPPTVAVDLTSEGTLDWAHWGLLTNTIFNRKVGGGRQISDFTIIGTNAVQRLADGYTSFSWSDGEPTPSTNGTTTGVFIYGIDQGFRLVVSADPVMRTLNLYVGLYGAEGKLQAYLSDFSAPAFTDVSLNNPWANSYARYTLQYAAASPGQTLTVDFTARTLHDQDFGNVSLQAATLQGAMRPQIYDPEHGGNSFAFSFLTEASRAYTVQFTDSIWPLNWQTLTNLWGDGNPVRVFDPNPAYAQRFYRIVAQ